MIELPQSAQNKDEPRLTCGKCKHFHELPPDPHNIGNQYKTGECRWWLVATLVQVRTPLGPGQGCLTGYAKIPENFDACSHFTSKVVM